MRRAYRPRRGSRLILIASGAAAIGICSFFSTGFLSGYKSGISRNTKIASVVKSSSIVNGSIRRHIPEGAIVAIIGAGAAGLSAARSFRDFSDGTLSIDVFEQGEEIGGTWVYSDEVGARQHSSMYRNLKTNIPKEVMPFHDEPFDKQLPSYITHYDVLHYLKDFARKHDLLKHIRMGTKITHISKETSEEGKWNVEWKNMKTGDKKSSQYDAVIVCNGHYTVPILPNIPGLEAFSGSKMHAHDYRSPERFKDKTVAVIGAGPSGVDISLEIAKYAKEVFRAQRDVEKPIKDPGSGIEIIPEIRKFEGGKGVWEVQGIKGSTKSLDAVVCCTGYDYSFPFLAPEIGISVKNRGVTPLYRHLYYTEDPTLVFVGLPWRVAPFPLFDCQTRHAASALIGKIPLPTAEKMQKAREEDERMRFEEMGLPKRFYHMFGSLQWEYCKLLNEEAQAGQTHPSIDVMQEIYTDAGVARRVDAATYRNRNYHVHDDGSWSVQKLKTGTEIATSS